MADNVREMKARLLDLIPVEYYEQTKKIVNRNIKCHDALTWDFENWRKPPKAKNLF